MAWLRDVADAQYNLATVAKQQQALPLTSAFTTFPENEVLRVFQLDALATQQEIVDILRAALYHVFDIPPLQSLRYAYQDELLLLLDAVLYRYSTRRLGQSVGDRLQNLVLRDEARARARSLQDTTTLLPSLAPHRRLLLLHAVLSLLVPYAARKLQRRALEQRWDSAADARRRLLARALRYAFVTWSLLSLANTLHFLVTGRYRSLLERLLSLRLVYGSQRMQRLTNLMFLNQHMTWQTWASLFHVLRVGRYLARAVQAIRGMATSEAVVGMRENVCCVCGELPTLAQRSNCGHLYCYYCIKSRLLDVSATGSFRCRKCGHAVHTCSPA